MPTPRKPRPKPAPATPTPDPIQQPTAAREATPPSADPRPRAGLYRDSQTVVMSGRHLRELLRAERAAQLDEVDEWIASTLAASVLRLFRQRFERD